MAKAAGLKEKPVKKSPQDSNQISPMKLYE